MNKTNNFEKVRSEALKNVRKCDDERKLRIVNSLLNEMALTTSDQLDRIDSIINE